MTKLDRWLQRSCEAVGLQVDFSFTVICPNGHQIRDVARIRGVGALNGMLIVSDYAKIKDHHECLILSGYGFSVLSEPEDDESFDIDSAKEMFSDWGWVDTPPITRRDKVAKDAQSPLSPNDGYEPSLCP